MDVVSPLLVSNLSVNELLLYLSSVFVLLYVLGLRPFDSRNVKDKDELYNLLYSPLGCKCFKRVLSLAFPNDRTYFAVQFKVEVKFKTHFFKLFIFNNKECCLVSTFFWFVWHIRFLIRLSTPTFRFTLSNFGL